MKHLILSLFALHYSLFDLSAAVPLKWTVETSRLSPAVFDVVRGETIALEAVFNSSGKPFEVDIEPVSIFWQTNGMGSSWWTAPAVASSNRVSAIFTPEMDPGSSTVNGFLGSSGSIYRAAFTFRFRHGPGATPNVLPLPVKAIDFSKVVVINPPYYTKFETDTRIANSTNAIHRVDGAARVLPKYLWCMDFYDSYPDDAKFYYDSRSNESGVAMCSSVRDGGFLSRNFDYPFDDRAEFVVRMAAGPDRFASVGVAQVGTNLTESFVTSGNPSRWYKCLPGATVDGINENGVACNINVTSGSPAWHSTGDLHPLAAVRWVLDHATNAEHAAAYIAANIRFPQGWTQNFHYMISDESETYIVENGYAHKVTGRSALTNFPLYPTRGSGEGQERYDSLMDGANITSQWWTLTYMANSYRASDLPGITGETLTHLFNYWENNPRESHRGETFGNQSWWQSIHTSVYDITNRVLRISVQEHDDWYVFSVPQGCNVKSVNGQTGDVKITADGIGALTTNLVGKTIVTGTNTHIMMGAGTKITGTDDMIVTLGGGSLTVPENLNITVRGDRSLSNFGITNRIPQNASDVHALPDTYVPPSDDGKRDKVDNRCYKDEFVEWVGDWDFSEQIAKSMVAFHDYSVSVIENPRGGTGWGLLLSYKYDDRVLQDGYSRAYQTREEAEAETNILWTTGIFVNTRTRRTLTGSVRGAVSNETFVTVSYVTNKVVEVVAIATNGVDRTKIMSPDGNSYQTSDGGFYEKTGATPYYEIFLSSSGMTYRFDKDTSDGIYYCENFEGGIRARLRFVGGYWSLDGFLNGYWDNIASTSGTGDDQTIVMAGGVFTFTRKVGPGGFSKTKQVAYTDDIPDFPTNSLVLTNGVIKTTDGGSVSASAIGAAPQSTTYTKTETDALIAASSVEIEDVPSNVVWRIEAEGKRFFFKPIRPIHMED